MKYYNLSEEDRNTLIQLLSSNNYLMSANFISKLKPALELNREEVEKIVKNMGYGQYRGLGKTNTELAVHDILSLSPVGFEKVKVHGIESSSDNVMSKIYVNKKILNRDGLDLRDIYIKESEGK